MAEFKVNIPALTSKMEELMAQNETLKAQKESLSTASQSLKSVWEGEAQAAFTNAVNQDLIKIQDFINLIEQYCQKLNEIIDRYRDAENRNMDTAATRTY
ncbi:MAG: WXG100 family type VII secretion target [Oscillospiraceae bacterium]